MDEWLDLGDFIDKCDELIELGLYDEALALLKRYMHIYGNEWELFVLYARIYTDQNRPLEAIPYLKKGLQLNKFNPDCLLGLFYAYSMLHQVKYGSRYLIRAQKYHPGNELVITALIWYYTEINEPEKAVIYFEKLQQKGTTNPEAFKNGALAYQRSGRYDNAEHCYKIVLELNPAYDEVRDMLADLYLFLEQEKKAIEMYQDALQESPRNIRFLSRLVYCHTQVDQFKQAASIAEEAIRLYPNSPIGYVDLAYVHLNNNRPKAAIEYADRAHDVSPLDAEAFRIKGIAYSEIGEWKKGRSAFETALSIDRENIEIMRDYYHHLRNAGNRNKMEALVDKVIKTEYPYCTEDYWFLADYYRENGENLKAFHFLNKAYKLMPGERELIPPMVDILLEYRHTSYSIPFLTSYVTKGGWNDIMTGFARHIRFRGKRTQEIFRFLRYQGQRPEEFRRYLFLYYLERYLVVLISLIVLLGLIPLSLLFHSGIIYSTVFGYTGIMLLYYGLRYLYRRKIPEHTK